MLHGKVAMISQPASKFSKWVVCVVMATAASACSTQQSVTKATESRSGGASVPVSQPRGPVGTRAAEIAMAQLGSPYLYGGSSPGGFDCSGLVQYSYSVAGKSVPRTTRQLWNHMQPVDGAELRKGDVLFFNIAGKMSHVGLYIGGGRFVHAPSSGKTVSLESLRSDYYSQAFIRAGRPR